MKTFLNPDRLLFIYRMLTAVFTPAVIPPALAYMLIRKKYRRQSSFRLGKLPDMEKIKGRSPVIWLHALSVGEVNAIIPLIHRIKTEIPAAGIVCSACTATGMAVLDKKAAGHKTVITGMPLDLPPLVFRAINGIRPHCFILTETDIWPGFIWHLKKNRIPALLINGSISSGAASQLAALQKRGIDAAGFLYGGFHTVAMQSIHDIERLTQCINGDIPRLTLGGNLKFDLSQPVYSCRNREILMNQLSIRENDFIFIAGSTHPGEEEILIRCFKNIRAAIPRLRFIIAPRNPDRAAEIKDLADSMHISSCMRSEGCTRRTELIILNTLGELSEIYRLGDMAFVGGSLVPTGGHNLFEPAASGIPVLWGPHTESCMDMAELLESGGGGVMIASETAFQDKLLHLAADHNARKSMGGNAAEIVKKHGGAVKKYMEFIKTALDNHSIPAS